jgi:glycosyltransferase involved in cell wall biosynthesis
MDGGVSKEAGVMEVAIGICARNEANLIVSMLDSVLIACDIARTIQVHLIICANGCSDQTIPFIKSWQESHQSCSCELMVRHNGNLVEAQRKIINRSKELGVENTIFLDADILVDKHFLLEICDDASRNGDAVAIYARSIPLSRAKRSVIERALNLYDMSGALYSKRLHLHGRAFLIKTNMWSIPRSDPQLVADDIYLSCYLLKKYGPQSIRGIDSARVYFNQITNYRDFYSAFRRRELELEKCLTLFPEFKELPGDQIDRRFLWKRLLSEPLGNMLFWVILLCLKKAALIQLRMEEFIGLNKEKEQWIAVTSSKAK